MPQTAAQKKAEDARTAQAKRNAKLTPREFQETHERGADGGLECNRRRTNISFKNTGTNNVTVDLSNCGLEHTLTDPANLPADQKPTEAMYDVVRHYLRMSFTGEVGSGVIKSAWQPLPSSINPTVSTRKSSMTVLRTGRHRLNPSTASLAHTPDSRVARTPTRGLGMVNAPTT